MSDSVSIIISAYKSQEFIEECLDSIAQQTYFKDNSYEILVGVDACAETLEKLKEIRNKFKNLRIFMMKENRGTYVTSNTLLDLVSFPNIIRFDSDDLMMPHMVERVMEYSGDYSIVRFSYDVFETPGKFSYIKGEHGMPRYPHGVLFIKKKIYDQFGGYQPWPCGSDTEFLNRIGGLFPQKEIPEPLFHRRIHPGSLTQCPETGRLSERRKIYSNMARNAKEGEKIKRVVNGYKKIGEGGRKWRSPFSVFFEDYKPETKKWKHCHFSILYNELPFLKMKLPFLYKHFHQIIFYDLNAFGPIPNWSTDGSHEWIKSYPDPEGKITLIEEKDLSKWPPRGLSNERKRRMFSYGSTFVRDDIDFFWCTDMDEFFPEELIREVERIGWENWGSLQVPHWTYWKSPEWILTQDRQLTWNHGDIAVRIAKHRPGNHYGHCDIGRKHKELRFLPGPAIHHLSFIGEDRMREKFSYYLNNGETGNVSPEYINEIWGGFSKDRYKKEKDADGIFGWPHMHPSRIPSGVIRAPKDPFKEILYLKRGIIEKMIKPKGKKKGAEEEGGLLLPGGIHISLRLHPGFSNYLICYGLIREIAQRYIKVTLLVKNTKEGINEIRRLYSGIPNVEVNIIHHRKPEDLVDIGGAPFFQSIKEGKEISFDQFFYSKLGVDLSKKWSRFQWIRDPEAEEAVFNRAKIGEDPYILLLEEGDDFINRKLLTPLRIVKPPMGASPLDMGLLIERAKEVHVVNGIYLNFIDITGIKKKSIFYHKYLRPLAFEQPVLKEKWEIL